LLVCRPTSFAPVPATSSVIGPELENPALNTTRVPATCENTDGTTDATTCAFAEPVDVPPVHVVEPPTEGARGVVRPSNDVISLFAPFFAAFELTLFRNWLKFAMTCVASARVLFWS
jgi:hypothetical protein